VTSQEHRPTDAIFEVTIAGSLGPLLRFALSPCRATPTQEYTLLRVAQPPERDLVDLVDRLQHKGLVVEDAFETGETSSALHDAAPELWADR
jgi:hypothetical protein